MSEPTTRPLVLDVDGTMIRSDLTHELLFEGFLTDPLAWPRLIPLAFRDKPALKAEFVARLGDRIDTDNLPLEPLAVKLAEEAKAQGREVYLCSGSEQSLVKRLAARLPYVDDAFGTVPGYNMTAQNKADFLTERFPDGFDYVGNSSQDYEPWEAAHTAYAIRPPRDAGERRSMSGANVEVLEARQRTSVRVWASALGTADRIWVVALIAYLVTLALGDGNLAATLSMCLAMLAAGVSLWRSARYAAADRLHGKRKRQSVATGALSVTKAAGVGAALTLAGLVATVWLLPRGVTLAVLAYLVFEVVFDRIVRKLGD